MSNTRNAVFGGLIWNFLERFAAQGVTLVVGIILARKLGTEAYGTVALVSTYISILVMFTGFSTGTALIQKKEVDELDYNSIFYFGAALGVAVYLVLFFTAPAVAAFYSKPELTDMIRVASLPILISIFQGNQCIVVSRNLQFRLFFFATLGGTVGAAAIGITMAYTGFGAWALIVQGVFNTLIDTILLWVLVKWRPSRMFSWLRVKALLGFSLKLWASNLLENVAGRVQGLVIGKVYTSSDLALYNKGESFPATLVSSINSSVNNVLFPTISKVQDERDRVCRYTSLSIRMSSFVIWPMMMGLAACARPLLSVLLGVEWIECARFVQVFCIGYAFQPIITANLSAIKAMGRSDIVLKLNAVLQISTIIILIISVRFGPIWIAVGMVGARVIGQLINALPNRRLLGYSYSEQFRDILPSVVISLIMSGCVYVITTLDIPDYAMLLIQVPLGVVIYVLLSFLFQRELLMYALSVFSYITHKNRSKMRNV